ncbi:hypothetical protein [Gracilimonas sp.]|uniref:hypothetical protein n=1 Tax=Gracilimonas sp. TaxID=1974203 RepID=UPI0028713021|nr:hypothetical protein [Gracilimonas sp.]
MDDASANLGVCFFSDRLFYSINDPNKDKHLFRIGSFDFNFNLIEAITSQHEDHFPHVLSTFDRFRTEHNIKSVRALTHPAHECWTVFPKVVYDNADEREDHLAILMKGVEREHLEPTWHTLHNNEYKFLSVRRRNLMAGFDELTNQVATTDFSSDFEMAQKWSSFAKPGGSFLMIGCHNNIISITSFLLGKFRAATYISFDQPEDLPYHWLQQSAHSSWLKGLHETIYLFGHQSHEVEQVIQGFWDSSAEITHLNSLKTIGVEAEEETYGFDLAAAFPAILLSLDF